MSEKQTKAMAGAVDRISLTTEDDGVKDKEAVKPPPEPTPGSAERFIAMMKRVK